MVKNKLRSILEEGGQTTATRISSSWPIITEIVGSTKQYDYVEYLAEYAPYTLLDLENLARACEIHGMGSIIKVDFQNRAYMAQKALACGIQGILFTDCKTADEVRDCIHVTLPDTPLDGGRMGYPNNRWIGYNPHYDQMDYAAMVRNSVRLFMIEKAEAVENIEEICKVPGVDMIQFGPSDYSMSMGLNRKDNTENCRKAERHCIEVALANGVQPRCEILTAEDATYYKALGVKHFCMGDQMKILKAFWQTEGEKLNKLVR